MIDGQKISKNFYKIHKLWNEKGANTVFNKVLHSSAKKLRQPPAKRTLAMRDSLFEDLDTDKLRQNIEHILSCGLFRPSEKIKKDIHQIPAELAKFIVQAAERILNNEFILYGNVEANYGPDRFSWFRDPLTGFTWPLKWLDNRNKINKPYGTDIKTLWEIGRFHFLSSLTYAYILTGEKKYARFAVEKVSSWIHKNPFLHRPHWWMPMESAIRVINWCVYLPLLDILKHTDLSFRIRLAQSIFEQLIYIRYNLESSPSQAGNHYFADLVGLIAAKLLFPSVEWATECTEFAIKQFQKETNRQFTKSGIYFQGSLPYHRLGSEIMLIGIALTKKNGLNLTSEIIDRIQQVAVFTKYYTDASKISPIIGDNDSGIFLRYFPGQESTNHRYLNCLFDSIIENRGKPNNFKEFLSCIHFAETELPEKSDSDKQHKAGGSQIQVEVFDGLIIARNETESLFFNTITSSQGHSHNDKLSIYPVIAGNQLLIDRGSFSYTGFWRKRHEDRITSSHNSPMINDWEQNKIWKDDLYYNNGEAKCFSSIEQNTGNLLITGWHVGYDRFKRGLKVFRQIQWDLKKRCISIADWVEGKYSDEMYLLKLNFLINPIWSSKNDESGFNFTYLEEMVYFEDTDRIGFKLAQSNYCPCYQIERNCEVLKASIKIRVGEKVRYRLSY